MDEFPFEKEDLQLFNGKKIAGRIGNNWGVRFNDWPDASSFIEVLLAHGYYVMMEQPRGSYFNVWFKEKEDLPAEEYRRRKADEDKKFLEGDQ
jgi:hypothetical protein